MTLSNMRSSLAGALGLKSAVALLAAVAFGTPVVAQERLTWYNTSDDPKSLSLIGLDTIAGSGSNTSVLVVDLFKGPVGFGMMNTWNIDCPKQTMRIVKAMTFDATGKTTGPSATKSEIVKARSTPRSWKTFDLVCSGEGNLEKGRVYHGEWPEIAKRFWGS